MTGQRGRLCVLASTVVLCTSMVAPVGALAAVPVRTPGDALAHVLVEVDQSPLALLPGADQWSPRQAANLRAMVLQSLSPVERAVVDLGGQVERRFADAVVGLSVSLPADRVLSLEQLPEVVAVSPVRLVRHANAQADDFTGASRAWQDLGVTGRGVKIAIIDTGIDYTHATFAGAGSADAYAGNDRTVIEPGTFPTKKVVAGYDFVGDDYDAYAADPARRIPHPDADPVGCGQHGTHVAGTAAGFGVTSSGATFTGPWTKKGIRGLSIGPGTAPEALLMAYQVFGCDGYVTSDIVAAAIDRAVADGADVINMSLGSDYGRSDSLDAIAADNAAKAGVVVVAAAGNSGPGAYLVGAPGSATRAISVAAMDARPTLPGGRILARGREVALLNANDAPLPVSGVLKVMRDQSGRISLGCTPADFGNATGVIAVVARGVCARVAKVAAGQQAGAVAVIMVNQDDAFPPTEGPIDGVTIPFLGVQAQVEQDLASLDGLAIELQPAPVGNPSFRLPADFTSAGPRTGDSGIKPDLTAPGSGVVSALTGTGTLSASFSGTSMATPVVAGIAALVRQRHPQWSPAMVKAALTGTATVNPKLIDGAERQLTGAGLVQPQAAIAAPLLLMVPSGASGISFGVLQPLADLAVQRVALVHNPGSTTIRASLSISMPRAVGKFSLSTTSITLAPGATARVPVTYALTAAQVRKAPSPKGSEAPGAIGAVVIAKVGGREVARLPLQAIVLKRSAISAQVRQPAAIEIRNAGLVPGEVGIFDWIMTDPIDPRATADLRAVGYRVRPAGEASTVPDDRIVDIAISQHGSYSNPARNMFTVSVDANRDGTVDHLALGLDQLFAETGATYTSFYDGFFVAMTSDLSSSTNPLKPSAIEPKAPLNGSTVVISVLASDLGISATNQLASLSVQAQSYADDPVVPDTTPSITVNLWEPQGRAAWTGELAVGARATIPLTTRASILGETPSLGWMVVCPQNPTGEDQAKLLPRAQ